MSMTTSLASPPEACLLRCKDNYMNEMHNLLASNTAEWSVNLVTPLQNLFDAVDHRSVRIRVQLSCQAHDEFMRCLNECPATPARRAILNGQESWSSICSAFRTDDEFREMILPCMALHGGAISHKCHIHALMVQNCMLDLMHHGVRDIHNNLADLCRAINIYDQCYLSQTDTYCGGRAWRFLLDLNQKTSTALIKLLSESSVIEELPGVCQQWASPEKYAQLFADRLSGATSIASGILFLLSIIISHRVFLLQYVHH
uniref:CPG4 domain-containing protein n=1 Tax=Panagrellus redivivus TaxID=6233 RepID=A0A7E4VIF7_PANRE